MIITYTGQAATAHMPQRPRSSCMTRFEAAATVAIGLCAAYGCNPINRPNRLGDTPLSLAVMNSSIPDAERVLRLGADIEGWNESGRTPLAIAAFHNDTTMMSFLLERGSRVDGRGRNGGTPLIAAAGRGALDACRLLIDRGASVTARSVGLEGPLHNLAMGTTRGLYAHQEGDAPDQYAETAEFLIRSGAELNIRDFAGRTPLYTASLRGFPDVVAVFLAHRADRNITNTDGESPLNAAIRAHARIAKGTPDEEDMDDLNRFERVITLLRENGEQR